MNPDELVPALRSLLGAGFPPDVTGIARPGGKAALAWEAEGHASPMTVVMSWLDDGRPRIALVRRDVRDAGSWGPGWPGFEFGSSDIVVSNVYRPPYFGQVEDFAASLSGPRAADALAFMEEGFLGNASEEWEWLADPVQGPSAMAFCRKHPWLARTVILDDALRARLADGHADDVAVAAATDFARHRPQVTLESDLSPEAAGALVECLRGFIVPKGATWERQHLFARAASRMPPETWPAPVAPGRGPDREAQADMAAFFLMSPLASPETGPPGRPIRSVLAMRGRPWSAYLATLHARCGLAPVAGGDPVEKVVAMACTVTTSLGDMRKSFASEVLAPALVAAGMDPRRAEWVATCHARDVLLGSRTLPRLCEVSRDWHARSAAISGFVAALRGDDGSAGPALFGDADLGEGLFATCLRTPEELAAEGAPGLDRHGARGLDHCVAGYAEDVAEGMTCIVSVRRRLPGGSYERLSTAEVDYSSPRGHRIVQHFGRRNSPPPPGAALALEAFLPATEAGAREALADHRPEHRRSVPQVIHEAGAWEAVRDMWSFALTRPQRAMGPAEFVAFMTGEAP